MKAKDLAKLLQGVDPEAGVYIDLGTVYNHRRELVYDMLNDQDAGIADVEDVTLTCFSDGIREVYLVPYDGCYCGAPETEIDEFFKDHNLDELPGAQK